MKKLPWPLILLIIFMILFSIVSLLVALFLLKHIYTSLILLNTLPKSAPALKNLVIRNFIQNIITILSILGIVLGSALLFTKRNGIRLFTLYCCLVLFLNNVYSDITLYSNIIFFAMNPYPSILNQYVRFFPSPSETLSSIFLQLLLLILPIYFLEKPKIKSYFH